MKNLTVIRLLVLTLVPATAALGDQSLNITYLRGSVATVKEGTAGTIDKISPTAVVFRSGSDQFQIPFARITSFRYHEESQLHVGVLPAIAVGLFRAWPKRHLITITWTGESAVPEVATLEASKSVVDGILELMRARAPEACRPGARGQAPESCGARAW